jgi:hypothetical protein
MHNRFNCLHPLRSRRHVRFKPFATMPTTTILELSPALATAKKGEISVSSHSTATSVTSFTTTSNDIITKEDGTLLTMLQERTIHAPPGPRPARPGTRDVNITQQHAERKALKKMKLKALEEKKLATVARRLRLLQRSKRDRLA